MIIKSQKDAILINALPIQRASTFEEQALRAQDRFRAVCLAPTAEVKLEFAPEMSPI